MQKLFNTMRWVRRGFAKTAALLVVAILVGAYVLPVLADFQPGETLDPGCLPSDPSCTVVFGSTTGAIWGNITGTVSNQTDLLALLNGKVATSTFAASSTDLFNSLIVGSTTLPASMNYWTKAGSDLMYTGGNIGIGTTTPGSLLTIAGTTTASCFSVDGGASCLTTGGGSGTVTSVGLTVPTGLSIAGSPVTTAGTLAISLAAGYNIPLTASTTNWNTAFNTVNASSSAWDSFYGTPSTRITAGTGLSWSGNTLNATGGGGSGTVNSGLAGQAAFYNANGTAVSGTSTLFINDERVSIGTTNVTAKLTVEGGSIYANAPASDTVINGGAGNNWQTYANLVGSAGYWAIRTDTSHGVNFDMYNGGSPVAALTIATNGNVGIGTTTPGSKLTVVGTTTVIGTTTAQAFMSPMGYGGFRFEDANNGEYTDYAVNIIGGYRNNSIAPGTVSSIIAGGGASSTLAGDDAANRILGTTGTHMAYSTISGGYDNQMDSAWPSTIAGGAHNRINMPTIVDYTIPVPGYTPNTSTNHGTISGGSYNAIFNSVYGSIGGGTQNYLGYLGSTTDNSTIAGGANNRINGNNGSIGGGSGNTILGLQSTIAGGLTNTASGGNSIFIGGGSSNSVNSSFATLSGGNTNSIGSGGTTLGTSAFLGGGLSNSIGSLSSAQYAVLPGGRSNIINGDYSTVLGGRDNVASSTYNVVGGRQAKATASGAWAFADSQASDFIVSTANMFGARFSGGYALTGGNVGIGTTTAGSKLTVTGNGWFGGNLTATGTLSVLGTATSTFAGAVQATCFTTDGTNCITGGGGGGSGTVNSGTSGYFSYYPSTGTTVDDQSVLYTDGTNIGISSTTPVAKLSVVGNTQLNGSVGIGTYLPVDHDNLGPESRTLQLGPAMIMQNVASVQAMYGYNAYFDSTNNWRYATDGRAPAAIRMDSTNMTFHIAQAGTAGDVISGWDTTAVAMTIASTTNVGIGTKLPTEKLSVIGNILSSSLGGGGDQCLRANNDGVISTTGSDCSAASQWLNNGSDIYFDTGNVGIGTNNPTSPLTIYDTLQTEKAYLYGASENNITFGSGGGGNQFQMGSYSGGFKIYDDTLGQAGLIIDNLGNSVFGGNATTTGLLSVLGSGTSTIEENLWVKGTLKTGTGSMFLNNDGLFSSNGNLGLFNNAASYINGNLGLGTSSPVSRFTIAQTANVATSGILIAPAAGAPTGWIEQDSMGTMNWGDFVYSYDIAVSDDGMVIAAIGSAAAANKIQVSTDGGVTWTERDPGTFIGFQAIAMSADGSRIVATEEATGAIYYSTNTGSTWTGPVSTGSAFTLVAIAASDDGMTLVAVNNEGGYIFTSTNGGVSWNADGTYLGITSFVATAVSADGTKMAIADEQFGSGGYIYTSTNSGASWTEQTSSPAIVWRGLTSSADGMKLAGIAASGYVYTSTDGGVNWTQQTGSGSRSWSAISSSADGQTLIASAFGYLYISTDGGVNWTQQTSAGSRSWRGADITGDGSKAVAMPASGYVYTYSGALPYSNREIYVDASDLLRIGSGSSALALTSGGYMGLGTTTPTEMLTVVGNAYISGTTTASCFSTDGGATCIGGGSNPWTASSSDIYFNTGNVGIGTDSPGYKLDVNGNIRAAVPSNDTGFFATDNSANTLFSLTRQSVDLSITAYGGIGFAGGKTAGPSTAYDMYITNTGDVGIGTTTPGSKLTVVGNSLFYGSATTTGLLDILGAGTSTIENNLWVKGTLKTGTGSMFLNNDGLFASNGNIGLFNNANSYLAAGNFGLGTTTPSAKFVIAQSANTESNGISFAPVNSPSGWAAQTNSGIKSWNGITISADGLKIAVIESDVPGYVNTSADGGASWTEQTNSAADVWWDITSSANGTRIAAIEDTNPERVYISTDSGVNWNFYTVAGGIQTRSIAMSADGLKLITGDWLEGSIYTSTNGGVNWTAHDGPGDGSFWYEHNSAWWQAMGISADGNVLVAAANNSSGFDGSIWISTNGGTDWTEQTGAGEGDWEDLAVSEDGSHIVAVDKGGSIWTTANGGTNWVERTSAGTRNWVTVAMSADGNTIAAGVQSGYIYISTNGGADWTEQTSFGTKSNPRVAMTSDGSKIAESTSGEYVYIYSAGAPGTNRSIFVDSSDLLRIGTGTSTASLAISPTGSLGVGTTSSFYKLNIAGTVGFNGLSTAVNGDDAICINADGEIRVNVGATDCTVSSKRFKHDIETLTATSGLALVNQLRPVSFKMNGTDEAHVGFVAEEVSLLDPRLTFTESDGTTVRGVRYQEMTAVLAKAVQELNLKVDSLASSSAEFMSGTTTGSTTTIINNRSWSAASLAAAVSDALSSMTEWVGQKITATVAFFGQITIGSSEKPSGITLFDEVTGEPYCMKVRNGTSVTVPGECTVTDRTPVPVVENPIVSPVENSNSTASSTATTTDPIVSASSTDPIATSTNATGTIGTTTDPVAPAEDSSADTEPTPVVENSAPASETVETPAEPTTPTTDSSAPAETSASDTATPTPTE